MRVWGLMGFALVACGGAEVTPTPLQSVAVEAAAPGSTVQQVTNVRSFLEVLNIETGERRVVYQAEDHFEAPNWSRDGESLVFNSHGILYRLTLATGTIEPIDTKPAVNNNNDHGLSPDGEWLAISDQTFGPSAISIVPATGGTPRPVTSENPSYWHGWSPDGARLAYVAERGGSGNYDIYDISIEGGEERRLTTAEGLDDGPDYGPDGTIYFNSTRTGAMRIWKMGPSGEDQTQLTFDEEYGDWFPHPSPDGQHLVFLSYDASVEGHPPKKEVVLRYMPADGSAEPRVIAELFGGQGTLNVPNWSPDSREFAFVSYELINVSLE